MSLELYCSVLELLDRVEKVTGKEVLVYKMDGLSTMIDSKTAREGDEKHYIVYSPNYTVEINHLVASKAIQMIRLYQYSPEKRKMAVAYKEQLNNGKMAIASEIERKPHLKVAVNDEQLTSTWILSLINQLVSQPVSINIEREIYNDFPDLRELQQKVIGAQFDDFNKTLSKEVENLSPSIIYNSSAIMNYVYLRSIDDITGSGFIDRLNYVVKKSRSEALYDYTKENLENSILSDYEMIDYWAEKLGLSQWYLWSDF